MIKNSREVGAYWYLLAQASRIAYNAKYLLIENIVKCSCIKSKIIKGKTNGNHRTEDENVGLMSGNLK